MSDAGIGDEAQRWHDTKATIQERPVVLGPYFSYIVRRTPRRLLHMLSYYKFAAKMIGNGKRVIEIGCSEGLGTVILAEFASSCLGLDMDADAIAHANESVGTDKLRFEVHNTLDQPIPECDAIVSLDTIEHIYQANEARFLETIARALAPRGICVIGTPNETSDKYASAFTRRGHVNLFSADRLRALVEEYFHNVFMFSANDEMVHTGFSPMAHYLLALGVDPRRR